MIIQQQAQDKIILAIVNEAFAAEDAGNVELSYAIQLEGAKLCKKWGIFEVSGLPQTWKHKKKIPDYS
jgi:hypothetical protein